MVRFSCRAPQCAQQLEVREVAELRRQRAVQVVPPQVPATARVGSGRGFGGADNTSCSTPYYPAHLVCKRGMAAAAVDKVTTAAADETIAPLRTLRIPDR